MSVCNIAVPPLTLGDMALTIVQNRKWQIFPVHTPNPKDGLCTCGNLKCASQGKHPRTQNGLKDSSLSPDVIRQWWTMWGNANIGIPTGIPNFIVVLDVDPRHDGDKSLTKLETKYGKLPSTFTVKTGDGLHYYFARFVGTKIKSVANALGPEYLGLDMKGEGGYVIGPGSLHVSGGRYEIINDVDPVDMPGWLETLLINPIGDMGTINSPPFKLPQKIPECKRNETLFKLAASLRAKGNEEHEIAAAVMEANQARCIPPLHDDEVIRIAQSAGKYPTGKIRPIDDDRHTLLDSFTRTSGTGIIHLEHPQIAGHLHAQFNTVSFNKTLYVYDKECGIYRENAGDLEQAIRLIIEETGAKCSITRDSRDILAYLLATDPQLKYPFNKHMDSLPVKNGILKLDFKNGKVELINHTPAYLFTFQLPIVYDDKTTGDLFHKEVISQYVDVDLSDEEHPKANLNDALYQIPAQALLQALGMGPFKKAYIIQGDADGGKTSYLSWLHALLGFENIGHASLHQIGTDQFVYADLVGQLLNTFDDLADVPLQNIGPFKMLTGGYDFKIDQKHERRYNARIFAVHVFTCNAPPDVPEKILFDPAFWMRWVYLHFDNVFPIDPNFTNNMFTQENLSGSFNRVIEMVFRIAKEGLVVNPQHSEVKETWQKASDPFMQFITEHIPPSSTEHTFDKNHLLDSFRKYCTLAGINQRKIPSTQKALSTIAFKNGFKDAQRGSGKDKTRVYTAYRDWNPGSTDYREATKQCHL